MVLSFWLVSLAICILPVAYSATTTRSPENDSQSTVCIQRYVNSLGKSVSEEYECPDFEGPSDKTLCCDKPTEQCCLAPKAPSKFYELPTNMAIIISVTVVLAAAILTGVMIVCCCHERCPLYMACRAEAKPDYIAKPDDVAGFSLMPDDNVEEAKIYEPAKAVSKGNY